MPKELKDAEKLATIEDPTARLFYAYQQRLDQEKQYRPVKPKIVPRWMLR